MEASTSPHIREDGVVTLCPLTPNTAHGCLNPELSLLGFNYMIRWSVINYFSLSDAWKV